MDKDFDKKRIIGSLKYGLMQEYVRSWLPLAIVAVALCLAGGTIGVILLAVYTARGAVNWGICAISVSVICVAISLILYFFIKWVRKIINIKKEMEMWLKDAVMITAYSTKIKETNTAVYQKLFGDPPEYRISIGFKYNGIHYKYKSSVDNCWGKFCDKEIDILYSPRFREVILLKPEKEYTALHPL